MTIVGNDLAYLDALFNVARFGASRFGAFGSHAFISIGGIFFGEARDDAWDPGILQGSLTVQDLLDDRANTASFSAWGFKPAIGSEVILTLGSKHNATRLFAGYVTDVNQVYLAKPVNRVFHCSCIDYTWRLMERKASGHYLNVSATDIVLDLLTRYAPAVTGRFVQVGLPVLDEMTITNEDLPSAFKRIANRVGAYFYVDESAPSGALHFFTTEAKQPPRALTPNHPSLAAVEREADLSQIVTRALSEGGGGNALAPVAVGGDTIPVDVATWYAAEGGYANIGPNRVRYTGVTGAEGAGGMVGPGVTPSAALQGAGTAGPEIAAGVHLYAYTWVTAAGETRPAPVKAVTLGAVPAPTVAPVLSHSTQLYHPYSYPNGGYKPGDFVEVGYSWATNDAADASTSGPIGPTAGIVAIASPYHSGAPENIVPYAIAADVTGPPIAVLPLIHNLFAWTRVNGGPWFFRVQTLPIPPSFGYTYVLSSGSAFQKNPPASFTVGRVSLSGIAVGPAGVTARKIYRSVANGAALLLQQTLANNVATVATDSTTDAALGAAAPAGDTSGLAVPAGQVNPGSTTITVTSTSWANAAGGWAIIGNGKQVIRYAALAGNQLTGIPVLGPGAIVAAVPYNSTITAAPSIVGIPANGDTAIRWAIAQGDPVNVLAVVESDSGQAAMRALIPGHSGVIEELVADGRLSLTEATARGEALLAAKSAPLVTLRYTSRDVTTRSGATVTANLPPPTDIHESLKIQEVTIDGFNLSPTTDLPPTFHVSASSERFSLEDLLRQARPE